MSRFMAVTNKFKALVDREADDSQADGHGLRVEQFACPAYIQRDAPAFTGKWIFDL